jgi:hypothetical protein
MVSSDVERGTSWLSCLHERLELFRIPARNEEGVGIVALWQEDAAGVDAVCAEAMGQLHGGLLATLVGIGIKGEIDSA